MYTASMTNQLPRNKFWLLLHFLPALGFYIYLLSVFMFLPGKEKIFIYQNAGAGFETFNLIRKITIWASGIVYVIWTNVLLWKHRRSILNQFSDVEKINLNWLRILTWGIGLIWMTVIFFGSENITFSVVVIFIFAIGFFGIRQMGIYSPENIIPPQDILSENKRAGERKEKYSKSGLSKEKSAELYSSLIELMTTKELYKNNELQINDLAVDLDIHPNYLSQVINEKEGKNFYDFVNSYRLKEFKRLIALPKYKQFTLLSIALECGFNSKSSFNRYFKKETGQTPSQYFALISKA
jgi:AraC-like DNA-binding protein